jgi:hypothetical protein
VNHSRLIAPLLLLTLMSGFAVAQVDLSGTWGPRIHEDQPERLPGPELADYLGLPINAEARQSALTWEASRLTLPEEQCRVHISPYIYRGPLELRIWDERAPESQKLVAIRQYIQNYEQNRTIWMDGRPHPPEYERHTWMGFSTGKWEGDILTVYTTHIKQGWVRRNGVPESDKATLIEHFIRHENYLTHASIVTDPVYLTEPLIKTQDFVLDLGFQGNWVYPCEPVEEVIRPMGEVPMLMPGTNDAVQEYVGRHPMVPAEAAMGGAETMYPEYQLKMKGMVKANAAK